MKNPKSLRWIMTAAFSALPLGLSGQKAFAQFPAKQDGHATDANNRVGSGGVNDQKTGGPAVTGNQIITGNVTGGKEFRGPTVYSDPRAFSGPIGGTINEDFVKNSNGAPPPNTPFNYSAVRPFYGDTRAIAPPSGFVPEGFTGGYVGTSSLTSPYTYSSTFGSSNLRQGLEVHARPSNFDQPDDAYLTGYGDPFRQNNLVGTGLTLPLLGLGQPGQYDSTGLNASQRQNMVDPSVQKMRDELREAAGIRPTPQPGPNGQYPQGDKNNPNDPRNPQNQQTGSPLNQPLNNPADSSSNAGLNNQAIDTTLNGPNGNALSGGQAMGESTRRYLDVPAPSAQSPQLRELQDRMKRYAPDYGQSDADANRQFQDQLRRKQELASKGVGGAVRPPDVGVAPQPVPPVVGVDQTLVIHSLAEGIKAKGLHDLLASAEDLMRQDKFASAIEKYDQAARVASNNAFAPLGRAIAELGAGFYAQAERDLRVVFRKDPELLWARIDLNGMLSTDRLKYLRKDLSDLSSADPKEARFWVLQAFLAYNTGNAEEAQKDFNEAETRTGTLDPTIRHMREHWIPSGAKGRSPEPAAPLSK